MLKFKLTTFFLLLSSFAIEAQNLVPSEILTSVFFIRRGEVTGTCFLVSVDNNDYLVTAKHLFPKVLPDRATVDIEILKGNDWIKLKPIYLIHSNLDIDVAVLDLKSNDIKENHFDLGGNNKYYLSQECFFLGFPFGLKMDDNDGKLHSGFPIPFVKKALISSFTIKSDPKGIIQIFLDGHNNPGFSGGPVVVMNYGNESKNKMTIIGVISAYLDEKKIIKTPLGDFNNTENSGIVVSYGFDHVIEIIKRK